MRAGISAAFVPAAALALALELARGAAAPAYAQPSAGAAATLQFDKGRALMKEKKYAEACAAFEQSQKLDPQIGTLYNLGTCYAELGKIASAWNAYREVGQRDTNANRKKEANRRAKELEKRLPKLLLVAPSPPPSGLAVTMNGVDVTALLGADSPVDPAEYKLKATAPGFAPWETTAKISDQGKTVTINIELQKPSPKEPVKPGTGTGTRTAGSSSAGSSTAGSSSAGSSTAGSATAGSATAGSATPDPEPRDRPPGPAPSRRKLYAVIVGAGGLATLATGLVFGTSARSKWNEAKALCGDDLMCDDPVTLDRGNQLVHAAESRARLSTALVAGGAVLLGAGAVLWLTAPSSSSRTSTALHLAPHAGPGRAGLVLGGRF